LKLGLAYRISWRTRDEAENAIFTHIDTWHNTRRIQKELGYLALTSTKPSGTSTKATTASQIMVAPAPAGSR